MDLHAATSWTRLPGFDEKGFFIIKNIYNPADLVDDVPEERGMIKYTNNIDFGSKKGNDNIKVSIDPDERQVSGSVARYNHPRYKQIHSTIRKEIEKHIGRDLFNTYYYDRFYFPGQKLKQHRDRDACEISVSIHCGTNLKEPYPFLLKALDDEKTYSVELEPGDGVVYKGCQVWHWRDMMPGHKSLFSRFKKEQLYYHQIFFHYVLADGIRSHCAGDCNN
jgi:hypothetical protein